MVSKAEVEKKKKRVTEPVVSDSRKEKGKVKRKDPLRISVSRSSPLTVSLPDRPSRPSGLSLPSYSLYFSKVAKFVKVTY